MHEYITRIDDRMMIQVHKYGQPAPGAESHYEFCCSFPQNAHNLHALESLIFIGFLYRLLRSSDPDIVTTLS